ncbi:S-layer homology domain-containing protein [Candidatus Peregrinibacteria bacterium]|nr:S-layer homology domain-containing protein [Candidatus Peregrinibacteria bacterium]
MLTTAHYKIRLRTLWASRFLASVLIFGLFASTNVVFSQVRAQKEFSDVNTEHKNFQAIEFLQEREVIEGYQDGTFQPEKTINRAEQLKILLEGQGISPDSGIFLNCFPDVKDEWFAKYVCYAKEAGWVEGYSDGYFYPSRAVNKVESLKMLIETQGVGENDLQTAIDEPLYEDIDETAWYAKYVHFAKQKGLLEETGSAFHPAEGMERANIAENLYRFIKVREEKIDSFPGVQYETFPPKPIITPKNVPKDDRNAEGQSVEHFLKAGSLKRPLRSDSLERQLVIRPNPATPQITTLPKGAFAEVFTFDLTALEKNVIITSLSFYRSGEGSDDDFSVLYLFRDSHRASFGSTRNPTNHMVRFDNLFIPLAPGETTTLRLKASISALAKTGNASNFMFGGSDMITTQDKTNLILPRGAINGPVYTIGSDTVGSLNITAHGTISNVYAGSNHAKIAEFQLSPSFENVFVHQIALHIGGTIDPLRGLSNFRLYAGNDFSGTPIAHAALVSKPYGLVRFSIPFGLRIEQGSNPFFTVFADIHRMAKTGDSINVYLADENDLYATGQTYGFGVNVNADGYNNDNNGSHSVVIQGEGDFPRGPQNPDSQVNISFEGPSASNVPIGVQNVRFFDFSINPEKNIEVKELTFTINISVSGYEAGLLNSDSKGSFLSPNFSNIRIVEFYPGANGGISTIMGPQELNPAGSDTAQSLTFKNGFKVDSGEIRHFSFVMDIADNSIFSFIDPPGYVTVTLQALSKTAIVNRENGTYITDIHPSTRITGNPLTLTTNNASALIKEYGDTDDDAGYGATKVPLLDLQISANSDVTVKKLYFTLSSLGKSGGLINEAKKTTNFSNIRLVDVETWENILLGPIELVMNGDDKLQNFALSGSWFLKKGSVKRVLLIVDVAYDESLVGEQIQARLFQGNIVENGYDIVPQTLEGSNLTIIKRLTP